MIETSDRLPPSRRRRERPSGWSSLLAGLTAALVGLGLPGHAARAGEAPQVVVSIKPLHSLAAAVMSGAGEPALLIRSVGSPHNANLRPSDARALTRADAVFWVGETLETFLIKPLGSLAGAARVVALGEAEGVRHLPIRSGGAWERHAGAGGHGQPDEHGDSHGHGEPHGTKSKDHAGHDHDHGHGSDHDPGAEDPHVWLDPRNAAAMVTAIAATLSSLDPVNAALYEGNARALKAELNALEHEIAARLAPVQKRRYVVFHDGYQYFEARFGTGAVGSVTVNPERAPGAKRVAALRDKIQDLGAVCIMSEPQFEPALVRSIAEATGARQGQLDPVGAALKPGPGAYAALLRGLADGLLDCLKPTS